MEKAKILVVDDEKIVLLGIEAELADHGYEVITAVSGEEAIELAKRGGFRLALVDHWMPGINGIETCRAIKACASQMDIILMSGGSGEYGIDRKELVAAGALDILLFKPFKEGELLSTVKKVLGETNRCTEGD